MFKKLLILFSLISIASLSAIAFDGSKYAQSGEELCLFLKQYYGGLNPYSSQCAMGAGSGEFTTHESGFCHKLILEERMNAGTCLSAISNENSDAKLDTCEMMTTEQEILNCLQRN